MTVRDNPDPAERGAYFPSQKSVAGQARTTDYDGPEHAPEELTAGRILMIGTEERYLQLENDVLFSTGNHPVETLLPLLHLQGAGYDVDVATLSGAGVKFEYWAFPDEDERVQEIYRRLLPRFRNPLNLRELSDEDIAAYDAVYLPGGHGAMIGLPESRDVQRVLQVVAQRDLPLIAICHGPAALAAGGLDGAQNPYAGYEVVAYPDAVDAGPSLDSGYLPAPMRWFVAQALAPQGITVLNDDVTGRVHRDRNLLSGDSPEAANALGHLAVRHLTGAED